MGSAAANYLQPKHVTMVKPNKWAKSKHKSAKQLDVPLVDTERDLSTKKADQFCITSGASQSFIYIT